MERKFMKIKRSFLAVVTFFAYALLLAACGSGGEQEPVPTYSIGGVVSNLNGTVVLQNNGTDLIAVTVDGVFSFPTTFTDGSQYEVTVETHPVGQFCAVTGNSGSVSGENVATVTVECVTAYTVGGNISGLGAGQTVELLNNGTDALSVSENGTFIFNTPVVVPGEYNVSIKTQPANQVCTPTMNSGVVSDANITTVDISCVTAYSVGGTISGLSGSVLLQNTSTEELLVNGDGNFVFATPVLSGRPYNVTVKTQPPGQTCTTSNSSGLISTVDITNVQITCKEIYTIAVSSSSSAGGTVTGGGSYVAGTLVTLTAYPSTGYNFVKWTEAGSLVSGSQSYGFSATTNRNLVANFAIKTYTITPSAGNNGTISPTNLVNVNHGSKASFNIMPNTGYTANVGGTCPAGTWSGNSYTTGAINQNCTVSASFAIKTLTVTPSAGTGGTISPNTPQTVNYNAKAAFTIQAVAGYAISTVNGTCPAGTWSGTTYTTNAITSSCTVSANFVKAYTVGGSVSGLATGENLVLTNNADTRTITANGTYTFNNALLSNRSYAVSVITQPKGQSCTVANGSGIVGTANVTNVNVTCQNIVTSLYPLSGENWNDYVVSNGTTPYNATDTACTGFEYNCVHGGERRVYKVPGSASCTGLTASDTLGAFDWACDASTGYARFISKGLKDNKKLSDLINFTTPATWKNNSLTVKNGTTTVATSPSGKWWTNPFVIDNDGMWFTAMGTPGTIYLVTGPTAQGVYNIGANKVALVVKPGVTLEGTTDNLRKTVDARDYNFLWVEGKMSNLNGGVRLDNVKYAVLRGVEVTNVSSAISIYNGSKNLSLFDVSVSNASSYGIVMNNGPYFSTYNFPYSSASSFKHIRIDHALIGIYLAYSKGNTIKDVTAANTGSGVSLLGSTYNTVTDITVSNSGSGVSLDRSSFNKMSRVTASNNIHGIYMYNLSRGNDIASFAAVNNIYGIRVDPTSDGSAYWRDFSLANNDYGLYLEATYRINGVFKVGNNSKSDCFVPSPGTCASLSTTLVAGINLASSFVGKVTVNDTINTSDSASATAAYPANPAAFDWTRFDNIYRTWGIDGLAFPSSTQRGKWTTGTGRIWDLSLRATDTVIRNVFALPNGNDLNHAVELVGDGDGICESYETCLYAPNFGSYQGHGALIPAGTFIDGSNAVGVKLLKYQSNGR